jgi:glycosyltransferase involved in cell wall biosynthesis
MNLINFCKYKNILPIVIDYVRKYEEEDYLDCLKNAKFGIILDAHESQGFAIEEALSCNVPLLVWNTKTMDQEYNSTYEAISCTSVPYWDERCGEIFYDVNELEETFNKFVSKLHTYEPRKYIEENLSVEKCGKKIRNLDKRYKVK